MIEHPFKINLPALPADFCENWDDQYIEEEGGPTAEYLRFNSTKGAWIYGSESTQLSCGTRCLAFVLGMRRGFVKFNGTGQEPEKCMAFAASSSKVSRESLGDLDETKWPTVNGKAQDPWQEYREVDLFDVESGTQYTWTASNTGSVLAVRRLVDQYRNGKHAHPDLLPVVELGRGSYVHKTLGHKVNVPTVKVVDWRSNAPPEPAARIEPELDDQIGF
jgi:hypothetical protein